MLGGFGIGRWFGFPVRIDYSWFLVFALVVWTFGAEFSHQLPGYAPPTYYGMSTAAGLLFFLSVLLHELAHSAVARTRGIEVEGITLFLFGGVAQTRMEAKKASDEFLLTAAGPLTSVLLAGAFFGLARVGGALGWAGPVRTVLGFLALLNLVLAIFNMFPGFPLDGGRIFRSVVWYVTGNLERATRWATMGGRAFGALLIAFGAIEIFHFQALIPGLWSGFIGWFLANAAATSYRQFTVRQMLSRVSVARVMVTQPPAVSPETSVQRLIEEYFLGHPHRAYPVVEDGAVLGLVGVEDVAKLGAVERRTTSVRHVMRPLDEVPVTDRGETLDRVLARLSPGKEEQAVVVEDGRLVGILTLEQIGEWVKRARELGVT
ncbi:MAG: site-2 protease family protein [Gemmatimonadota bacterium]